jgi:flagellar biosynthesis/type III secretory pathway M-ring protein FliF/YscJ
VQIYLRANRNQQEPDDALLQPVVNAHSAKIRGLVKNALGLENDDDVTVEAYEDAAPASFTAPPIASAASAKPTLTPIPAASLVSTHAYEIALIGGGVVGLLLLSVLLRRKPARAVAVASARRADVLNGTIEDGQDDNGAHQMFRRVRDVVAEHPDQAARVLRQWIHQND